MASTATTRNRLEKQGAGENANTWGAPKLNNLFDQTDAALDGWTVKALTGDITLTSVNFTTDEARQRVLKFTGEGPFTVTIPAVEKWYVVWNACSAALTLTTGSGLTVAVGPTEISLLICDGTNVRALGADAKSIKAYVDAAIVSSGGLPSQGGQSGKALTTNGTVASWAQLGAAAIADGAVSSGKLATGAAAGNIGYTPANKAGDTFSGPTTFGAGASVTGTLNITSAALGATAGAASIGIKYASVVGSNTSELQERHNRLADGSDWTGTAVEIIRVVDGNYLNNLRFDPVSGTRAFSFRNEGGIGDLFVINKNGDVTSIGNLGAYSDRRLKDDIRPIEGSLALVEALSGVRFTWRDGRGAGVGVIAQDVQAVFPELVTEIQGDDGETTLSVAYPNLVAPVIEALKEVARRVDALERKVGE